LENFAKYITVVCGKGKIMPADLPFHLRENGARNKNQQNVTIQQKQLGNNMDFGEMTWGEVEEQYVMYLLRKNSDNVTWAAEDAGVNRSTFVSRMKRLEIYIRKRRRRRGA
jgi:DNA-binding NtrC family response regulator